MEDLNELLLSEGQHYEVHRHGNFATLVLGLKDKEKRYIAFQPFADIQTGDDLVEQISRDRFEVVDTEIEVNQRIAYRKKAFIKKYQPTPVKNPGDLLNPGEHYHVERKSQQIGQVWAAKDIEEKTGRKIVWFFPDVDVQAGDFLVNIVAMNEPTSKKRRLSILELLTVQLSVLNNKHS